MQNQPTRPRPSVQGISCEGYTYTLSPKTLAEGSAVNWSRIKGFCPMAEKLQAIARMMKIKGAVNFFIILRDVNCAIYMYRWIKLRVTDILNLIRFYGYYKRSFITPYN